MLLGLFDIEHPEWSIRELCEHTGLPKPTVRRLIKTLEAAHWLAYDPESRKYHLGSSALRASYVAMSHAELVRLAHPILVRLTEETTESTSLSIWADRGALIIDTVPTARAFKPLTFPGMPLDGTASADARVLLAFSPPHIQEAALARPQAKRTPQTTTDPDTIRERLRETREKGIAFESGEWNPGALAVAAPVFDASGDVRASISVVAPLERGSPEQMDRYAEAAKKAAAELSALLGYRPRPNSR